MPPDLEEWEGRLPVPPKPVANYASFKRSGRLVFTAGILPFHGGQLQFAGKVGKEVSVEEGYEAARTAALLALSILRESLGSLSEIARVLQLVVYVASGPDFTAQAKVADGASDLLVEVLGDDGRPARIAIGAASLPLDAPVELALVAESKE